MPADFFFDTNILIYAYDTDAGEKRETAAELVGDALRNPGRAAISVQVLQEFFINFVRHGHSDESAAEVIDDFSYWQTVSNTRDLFFEGLLNKARWQLSLWDAMILTAAQKAGTSILYTEDLNHGQNYGSVKVVNPFVSEELS